MSTVTIRGLSDETHENLRQLAASNNRSMEAEAREASISTVECPAFRGSGEQPGNSKPPVCWSYLWFAGLIRVCWPHSTGKT